MRASLFYTKWKGIPHAGVKDEEGLLRRRTQSRPLIFQPPSACWQNQIFQFSI